MCDIIQLLSKIISIGYDMSRCHVAIASVKNKTMFFYKKYVNIRVKSHHSSLLKYLFSLQMLDQSVDKLTRNQLIHLCFLPFIIVMLLLDLSQSIVQKHTSGVYIFVFVVGNHRQY